MVLFWIIVITIVLILIYAIFEGVGTMLLGWIFDCLVLGVALTFNYIKTRMTLGPTAAIERCQQVRSEYKELHMARKEQERQAEAKFTEWQRKHPVRFALSIFASIGLPLCYIAGMETWKSYLERQRQATRVILNRLADEALTQMEQGETPSSGMLIDQDVWGSSIERTYLNGDGLKSVFLRSSGRDQRFQTPDDLTESRRMFPTAAEAAGRLIDRGFDKLRDKARGLIPQRPSK